VVYTPQSFLSEFVLFSRLLITEKCKPYQLDIHLLKMLILGEFLIHLGPDIYLLYGENTLFVSPIVAELTALHL
jgi:hypothetical protein